MLLSPALFRLFQIFISQPPHGLIKVKLYVWLAEAFPWNTINFSQQTNVAEVIVKVRNIFSLEQGFFGVWWSHNRVNSKVDLPVGMLCEFPSFHLVFMNSVSWHWKHVSFKKKSFCEKILILFLWACKKILCCFDSCEFSYPHHSLHNAVYIILK